MDIGGITLGEYKTAGALRGILLAALLVFVLCCTQACFADEFRAFWVDGWDPSMLSQSGINGLLGQVGTSAKGDIRDANCNAIFVEVRRNADVCYPSGMTPPEPYFTSGNFNALQALINAAHDTTGGKQRVEVHAWIVPFRTGGGTVYGLHHDTSTGSLTNLDNYWPTCDSGGVEASDKAFDPGHPLAEQYTVNVAMDLVNNPLLLIDGIHFDYVRFTASTDGYNPTSVARYNARYGTHNQPSSTDPQWQDWRRDQITAVVRQVYARVQHEKPSVLVSGSFYCGDPAPADSTHNSFKATQAYKNFYSDWDSWVQEGIVDMAVPMTYFDLSDTYAADYGKWMNFEKDRKANRHMIVGPGLYMNSLANSITELQRTRDPSPAGNYAQGFSGFSHRVPYVGGTWSGFSPTFVSQVANSTVSIPVRPWKTSPTKGHISGRVTYLVGGAWADGATVSIAPDPRPVPYNVPMPCDGTGFYAFIDLPTGTYTMTVSKPGYPNIVRPVTVAIGSVTGNMYVNDFSLAPAPPVPVITNVVSHDVTSSSARITWDTDQAATTQILFGKTASYGFMTAPDPSNVTSHTVNLSGLSFGTTYHYKPLSTNGSGDAVSGDYTFNTLTPLKITNVQVTGIAGTTATIIWTTDQASSSKVDYGLTNSYGSSIGPDSTPVTAHSMTLTGLDTNTLYHYHVVSGNANGTVTYYDRTFTTSGMPTITNVQSTNITDIGATITWNTDMATTSQVEYGLTPSYGSATTLDSNPVVAHSVGITGLAANTTYNYRVVSTAAGGTATSGNYTFKTNGPPTISNVHATNITSGAATIAWTTENAADSTVNYGLTTSYSAHPTNSGQITSHSITISGLAATTLYHYQCVSTNTYATDTSADYTFTTAAIPAEIIVDNTDVPGWANTSPNGNPWTVYAGSMPKIGVNYFYYPGAATATRKCTWTPDLPQAGLYDVYAYYQTRDDRNTAATYTVYHYGGQSTSVQNQHSLSPTGTGDWFLIGENLPFNAGTTGYVELTNLSTDTVNKVGGDAVKWVYKSALDLTPPGVTIGAPSVSLTNTGPVSYTVYYDGADYVTLAVGNITLNTSGTASALVSVTGSGTSAPTVTLSSITGTGTLGISLAAGTASDNAANMALAAGPSTTFSVDNTAPTISVGAPSVTSTADGPVDYTVSYSGADAVTLMPANITLVKTGSADAAISVMGGGTSSRTVTVSSITGDGTLGISIASGTASDITGNIAPASGASATFSVDNSAPSISLGEPSVESTTTGPVSFTVTYGEADDITLDEADITLNNTGTADGTVVVSGTGTTTRTVTISSITGSGTLGISIAAGTATDAADNLAAAAGPSTTFAVDNTAPEFNSVAVSPPMAAIGDTVHVVVDVSDETGVTGVTANLTPLAKSSGNTWAGDIFAVGPLGVQGVTIVASDAGGNSATDTSATYKTAQVVGTSSRAAWQAIMESARGIYLFKFWGTVTEVDDNNFTLSDGSPVPITVHAPGYKTKVATGDHASARGILNIAGSARWIESELGLIVKY